MECRVFYSWQTDLPNATNRGFIQTALENAAKIIRDDESIKIEPVIDRDTAGVPGAPDIADTILAKIEKSQIFIADVSIINKKDKSRKLPNPNVLVELGYAMKALGLDRIIMVMNTAFGKPELLPFDLRMRRVITYQLPENEQDRSVERKKLSSMLEQGIRAILTELNQQNAVSPSTPPLLDQAITAITTSQPNQAYLVRKYMKSLEDKLSKVAPSFPGTDEKEESDEILVQSLDRTLEDFAEYSRVSETIAFMNSQEVAISLVKYFENFLNAYEVPAGFSGSFRKTRLDYFKFIGHELFVVLVSFLIREARWEIITRILDEGFYRKSPYASSETVSFEGISDYVETLEYRNRRLELKRISVHADILNERHTKGQLAEICPMDQFIAADFFLFLRAGFEWRPWSCLYLYEHTPRFILETVSKRYAEQLLQPLKVNNIESLRELLKERIVSLHGFYNRGFWRSRLDHFDLATIASK